MTNHSPILKAASPILRAGGWDGIGPAIVVHGRSQSLHLLLQGRIARSWSISTAKAGFGSVPDSGCTPTGLHRVAACIGADQPLGMIFKAREPTGELAQEGDTKDLITTRILWLDGLEPGHNQGQGVDTRARYIYIHGTPHTDRLGTPASGGCVRMADSAMVELFDLVREGTLVLIWSPEQGEEPNT